MEEEEEAYMLILYGYSMEDNTAQTLGQLSQVLAHRESSKGLWTFKKSYLSKLYLICEILYFYAPNLS